MELAFDNLQVAKQLPNAGIAKPQVEAIVHIVSDKHEDRARNPIWIISGRSLKRIQKPENRTEYLREEIKADIENLRDLIEDLSENVGKDKSWIRWAVGLNTAMLIPLIRYILHQ